MASHLPTPKRVGTIAVGGALVNVAALGFPDGAAVVARSVTALLVLMLLVMVYTHREEWLDYLRVTRRRGRLTALIATIVFAFAFVGSLTWLNWPSKQDARQNPSRVTHGEPMLVRAEGIKDSTITGNVTNAGGIIDAKHIERTEISGNVRTPVPTAPEAPPLAGRLVIDQPLFKPSDIDPARMETSIRVNSAGPGIAYAGTSFSDFAFVAPLGDLGLDQILANARTRALAFDPPRNVEIDAGTSFVFPTSLHIPTADFEQMTSKTKRLVFVEAYAYRTNATPPNHVEIALLAMVISGLSGNTWSMSIEHQSTKTYPRTRQ